MKKKNLKKIKTKRNKNKIMIKLTKCLKKLKLHKMKKKKKSLDDEDDDEEEFYKSTQKQKE